MQKRIKRRQTQIGQNHTNLAEIRLLERQEDNFQKLLDMHKKLLGLIRNDKHKVNKLKDVLKIQTKLTSCKSKLREALLKSKNCNYKESGAYEMPLPLMSGHMRIRLAREWL